MHMDSCGFKSIYTYSHWFVWMQIDSSGSTWGTDSFISIHIDPLWFLRLQMVSEIRMWIDMDLCKFMFIEGKPNGSILIRMDFGSYECAWVHMDSYVFMLNHMDAYGWILTHVDSYSSIFIFFHMDSSCFKWFHMGSSGFIWVHMGACEFILLRLDSY